MEREGGVGEPRVMGGKSKKARRNIGRERKRERTREKNERGESERVSGFGGACVEVFLAAFYSSLNISRWIKMKGMRFALLPTLPPASHIVSLKKRIFFRIMLLISNTCSRRKLIFRIK